VSAVKWVYPGKHHTHPTRSMVKAKRVWVWRVLFCADSHRDILFQSRLDRDLRQIGRVVVNGGAEARGLTLPVVTKDPAQQYIRGARGRTPRTGMMENDKMDSGSKPEMTE